jgi:hypothetical protein
MTVRFIWTGPRHLQQHDRVTDPWNDLEDVVNVIYIKKIERDSVAEMTDTNVNTWQVA